MRYKKIDDATAFVKHTDQGCCMAKMDLKHAFRLCSVRQEDWDLLRRPILRQQALALRSTLLNECHINRVLHYLDDFFFDEPHNSTCHASMTRVKNKAHPRAYCTGEAEQTGPTTTITFLGIELDSEVLVAKLPPEKLRDLMDKIPQWLSHRKATKCDLQSIIGKFSFVCKVIPTVQSFYADSLT